MTRTIAAVLLSLASPVLAADREVRFETSACMAWIGDWSAQPQGVCSLDHGAARCTLGAPRAPGYTGTAVSTSGGSLVIEASHERDRDIRVRVACDRGQCHLIRVWHERTGYVARCAQLTDGGKL